MKMDPEKKAAWIAALRSGKYQQGRFQLRTVEGPSVYKYCCLGVYGEINGLFSNEDADAHCLKRDQELRRQGSDKYHIFTAGLYPSLVEHGISAQAQSELSTMNDGTGPEFSSFDQIADWIEANL